MAIKINKLLFEPELDTKIIHFPIAGSEYSAQSLELVFGIVNMINGLDEINLRRKEMLKKDSDNIIPEKDEDGSETLKYLNKVDRIISLINSNESPISLGLAPLIYFYSYKGRFQITSFFAVVHLFLKWDNERKATNNNLRFQKFSAIREYFEEFLLMYKNFITQATLNVGSGLKSYARLSDLFEFIIDELINGESSDEIIKKISSIGKFGFIKVFEAENRYEEERNPSGKKPPRETVIEVAIKTYLNAKILCPICNARATFESYNTDHIIAIRDGGLGNNENLRLTHCYCNEERERILSLKLPK